MSSTQVGEQMQPRHTDSNNLGRAPAPAKAKPAPSHEAKKKEQKRPEQKQKSVEFVLNLPQANSVIVAGTFNNWDLNKNPLRKAGGGWRAKVELPPGRHEYRFVVDGQWISDPNAKECIRNDFGSTNSVLVV
jgi:1,4-alpha-glucan branching enzyme